jgi:hypothetical protein
VFINLPSAYAVTAKNASARVTGHRPVIRVNDGFEEVHN